jgi:hypothetical protein
MFAGELHIPPWDIGRLTVDQIESAVEHFDELLKNRE